MNIIYTEEQRIQVLYIHGSEAPAQEDPRSSFAGRGSEVHGQEIDRKADRAPFQGVDSTALSQLQGSTTKL